MTVIDELMVVFKKIYQRSTDQQKQMERFQNLIRTYREIFNSNATHLFSSPGRVEIGGNHTDHNNGRVLAASVNVDVIAAVERIDRNGVIMYSEGYEEPFIVNLNQLRVVPAERGSTNALIRGIAEQFTRRGFRIGGFQAYVTSKILPGSGLSSSAAIEVLIASIFNWLYNGGQIPSDTIAKIGQYAENVYFGKPCGLMDQIACAVGGIISIDFKNPEIPVIERVEFDLKSQGYSLLVVNTGEGHEDLTEEYAAIPAEMKAVAAELGKTVCREISLEALMKNIPRLRTELGDRAILRAYHFFKENERVRAQVQALKRNDFARFLSLINESGNSSFRWLQNIYSSENFQEQGVALALAMTEEFISEIGEGACRVHGGGFAGTILVFLPEKSVSTYRTLMEGVFGKNNVLKLNFRSFGTVYLNSLGTRNNNR